jgi:hypothetical protein
MATLPLPRSSVGSILRLISPAFKSVLLTTDVAVEKVRQGNVFSAPEYFLVAFFPSHFG